MLVWGQTDSPVGQSMEVIYKCAGLSEQLGKENFFQKVLKQLAVLGGNFKLDPYFTPNERAIPGWDGIDPIDT